MTHDATPAAPDELDLDGFDELASTLLTEGARLALERYTRSDVAALLRRLADILERPHG